MAWVAPLAIALAVCCVLAAGAPRRRRCIDCRRAAVRAGAIAQSLVAAEGGAAHRGPAGAGWAPAIGARGAIARLGGIDR